MVNAQDYEPEPDSSVMTFSFKHDVEKTQDADFAVQQIWFLRKIAVKYPGYLFSELKVPVQRDHVGNIRYFVTEVTIYRP